VVFVGAFLKQGGTGQRHFSCIELL
jgi:hypothetical protein